MAFGGTDRLRARLMETYILRWNDRTLELCASQAEANRIAQKEGISAEKAILHSIPQAGRTCTQNDLAEVKTAHGARVYLSAPNIGSALAAVALQKLAAPRDIASVRFYMMQTEKHNQICKAELVEESTLSPLTRCLLPSVNETWFRLFAHSINTVNEFETEEALKRHEIAAHTSPFAEQSPYQSPLAWTAEDIFNDTKPLWSYLFWESTGADLDQIQHHAKCQKTKDAMEALIHSYLFAYWGCYDCRFPHTLFTLLRSNSLLPYEHLIQAFDRIF